MSDISREEVYAKLETAEARVETRFAVMDGKLDRLLTAVQAGRDDSKAARDAAERATEAARAARSAVGSVTWNMIFVALGTIGLVIAIYAYGSQLLDLSMSVTQTLKGAAGK